MTRAWFPAFLVGLSVMLGACGSAPIVAHRTSLDLASHPHRSYAMLSHPVNHGALDDLVAASMGETMAARGYTLAASQEEADLLISYAVLLTDSGGSASGAGAATSDVSEDPDGGIRTKTLVVMLLDARTRAMVWVGTSTTRAVEAELRSHAVDVLADLRDRIPPAGGAAP